MGVTARRAFVPRNEKTAKQSHGLLKYRVRRKLRQLIDHLECITLDAMDSAGWRALHNRVHVV
ncbi:hypothetical protein DSM3645_06569 [Blastopirellula marina DSM 3645]|uniref:Uncharacterized protein n=1 Tax=Blastopirellula marina DSM 3645 TaxID=314230 RepID=A4A143_9BACT|nr:hypothetical protein DSM3645_06569 [Blastopirellula marina DSM 3645]